MQEEVRGERSSGSTDFAEFAACPRKEALGIQAGPLVQELLEQPTDGARALNQWKASREGCWAVESRQGHTAATTYR